MNQSEVSNLRIETYDTVNQDAVRYIRKLFELGKIKPIDGILDYSFDMHGRRQRPMQTETSLHAATT